MYDILVALVLTITALNVERVGISPLFTLDSDSIVLAARAWLGPILTLLGMTSATTAFIFSVVDRSEFLPLRKSNSESQLWLIFSENLFWLAVASIASALVTFSSNVAHAPIIWTIIFLFNIVAICILKFAWVMRQIISVRMSR